MKIALVHLLALAGAAQASTEGTGPRHLRDGSSSTSDSAVAAPGDGRNKNIRRADEAAKPKEIPTAAELAGPPEAFDGTLEFVGELDVEDQDANDAVEDEPKDGGHRELATCKTRCYLNSCKLWYYNWGYRYYVWEDCCQLSSGSWANCH